MSIVSLIKDWEDYFFVRISLYISNHITPRKAIAKQVQNTFGLIGANWKSVRTGDEKCKRYRKPAEITMMKGASIFL